MCINSGAWKGSSSGAADEQVGELVEALDRAVLGGGRGRCDAFVGVPRHQRRVADAGVHGDRGDARVGGEDGERELRLGVGGEPGVAAGAVGVAPLDVRGAVQGRRAVDDPAAGVAGECGFQQAGQEVVGEEVDLAGDLVAVRGDGVPLGRRHARVVDEHVEVRVLGGDLVRQGLDLVEVGEVGAVLVA